MEVKETEAIRAIVKAINNKGWNFYCRGAPRTKVNFSETIRQGPVTALEQGILYDILPKVNKPTEEKSVKGFINRHKVMPKILVVKDGFPYFGRVVAEFSGGDEEEFFLHPGEEVYFIGIELQEKEVRLLAQTRTYMPYSVFQKSLESLQDITNLKERNSERQSNKSGNRN